MRDRIPYTFPEGPNEAQVPRAESKMLLILTTVLLGIAAITVVLLWVRQNPKSPGGVLDSLAENPRKDQVGSRTDSASGQVKPSLGAEVQDRHLQKENSENSSDSLPRSNHHVHVQGDPSHEVAPQPTSSTSTRDISRAPTDDLTPLTPSPDWTSVLEPAPVHVNDQLPQPQDTRCTSVTGSSEGQRFPEVSELGQPNEGRGTVSRHSTALGAGMDGPGQPSAEVISERTVELPATSEESNERVRERRVPPRQRAGRPAGQPSSAPPRKSIDTARRSSFRPEIVCWERRGAWEIGFELRDAGHDPTTDSVEVEASPEAPAVRRDAERMALLELPVGELNLISDTGRRVFGKREFEPPIVFRLTPNGRSGRRVRKASSRSGTYLVVVPSKWTLSKGRERAVAVPEGTWVPGLRAWIFRMDQSRDAIRFTTQTGTVDVEEGMPITLTGIQADLPGDDRDWPIFLGTPPVVDFPVSATWSRLGEAVLIAQGIDGQLWRKALPIGANTSDLRLEPAMKDESAGRYELRIYDPDWTLVAATYFQFLRSATKFAISPHPSLPNDQGHAPIEISLEHGPDLTVRPLNSRLSVTRSYAGSVITLLPEPMLDSVDFVAYSMDSIHPPVQFTVRTNRAWWAMATESAFPSESQWRTDCNTVRRRDFGTQSDQALWLRLPRSFSPCRVSAGFEGWPARPYPSLSGVPAICIPLREYADNPSIAAVEESRFHVELPDRGEGHAVLRLVPLRLQADIKPPPAAYVLSLLADARRWGPFHLRRYLGRVYRE